MSHEFELHAEGETIVRLTDREAVEDFFGLFEIEIPAVVFETLRPGVPFIIRMKSKAGLHYAVTLYRVAPLHLAYQPHGPLVRATA
jgi:hypothetical protein